MVDTYYLCTEPNGSSKFQNNLHFKCLLAGWAQYCSDRETTKVVTRPTLWWKEQCERCVGTFAENEPHMLTC